MKNAPRLILAVDQAAKSGWCIVFAGQILDSGTATHFGARKAVLEQLLHTMNAQGLTRSELHIVLEDHSRMPSWKGRGTATLVGTGKAWGRWEEQAQAHGVPLSHVHGVTPATWRGPLLEYSRGGDEARRRAKELAERTLGRECEENEAEAVCIGLWAAGNLTRVLRGEPAPKKPRAKRRKAAA